MGTELARIQGGAVRYRDFELSIPDLELREGIYWLSGPNGSGKTTLFRVLLLLQHLVAGTLRRDADRCGYLPQNYRDCLFPWLSVSENLFLFGRNTAFLESWSDRLGLRKNELGRRAYHLSGGQAQRVALVRECSLAPPLLLLDEPFSALDVDASEAAAEMLIELQRTQGGVIVFTAHGASSGTPLQKVARTIEISRVSDGQSLVLSQ